MFNTMIYLINKLNKIQNNILNVSKSFSKRQKEEKCLSPVDIFTSYDTFSMKSSGHAVFLLYPVFWIFRKGGLFRIFRQFKIFRQFRQLKKLPPLSEYSHNSEFSENFKYICTSTKNIIPNIFQRPQTLTESTHWTIAPYRPITPHRPHTSHNIAYMHYMAYTRLYYGYLVVRLYGCISLSCVSIYLYLSIDQYKHINTINQTNQ